MNDYINSLRQDTSYQGLQILEKNTTSMLAGHPAFKLVFTSLEPNSGINYKTMVIGTIVGTKEYTIYSTAFSDQFSNLMPTMQAMSDSFQVQ